MAHKEIEIGISFQTAIVLGLEARSLFLAGKIPEATSEYAAAYILHRYCVGEDDADVDLPWNTDAPPVVS